MADPAGGEPALTKSQAQHRADQIRAFACELEALDREGVLRLDPAARSRVEAYHAGLLEQLAGHFDVDRSEIQRRMSLGMRVASLIGAVALSAAVVLFFYRVWGLLAQPSQLALLAAAPLALLAALAFAARREATPYVASILAVTAIAAFILDITVVGAIFNMRPSPVALGIWGLFALVLAYRHNLRLLLAGGLAMLMVFLCMVAGRAAGIELGASIARPEPLLPAGALVFAASALPVHRRRDGFPETARAVGAVAILLPIIFLSTWPGVFSYLPWSERAAGLLYDAAGFAAGAVAIWYGLRAGWREVVAVAAGFLVIFVVAKCFDWWWNWMPRYLFFLLLGALAVAALAVLGRVRARQRRA